MITIMMMTTKSMLKGSNESESLYIFIKKERKKAAEMMV